ncbi:MAG: tetratricopeptide repeat protein [Phycisphaerae bacterium]|jgi:serine/threonine protein kinase/Flp pilus assembly protein TadD
MTSSGNWYEDEGMLLGELKHRDARGPRPPSIDGYDRFRELRRGGQGVVYSAVQLSTKRRVAVKVLLDGAWASDARRRRFEREVDLIASLRHPNIVQLFDSGVTDEGHPYYVMEFIDGVGLDELVAAPGTGASPTRAAPLEALDVRGSAQPADAARSSILTPRAALELMARVAEAVSYAHQRGVIHRDLKPSNIRVDPEGQPHVLDFGLAKHTLGVGENAAGAEMSRTGEFMGSLFWASPEQTEGVPEHVDVRSDVYSLGLILFQLLTGQFPYPVTGPLREVLASIQQAEPLRPSALRRGLDDEIDTIVLTCLAKNPARRYQAAGELARDLRHYLAGEPIEAKRDSAWYTLRKSLHRYRFAARVASVFLVFALTALAVTAVLWLRATEAEQLAEQRRQSLELARQAEAEARQQAERDAAQARAVSGFLTEMLARPVDLGREARVADVLDQAAAELNAKPALGAEIESALRHALGVTYASLGLYAESRRQLEAALELRRSSLGAEHPRTLESLSSRAWLERLEGRLDAAERSYRIVLETNRRTHGEDHLDTVTAMNDLAIVLESLGKLDEAERLHREALEKSTRLLGPKAATTLTSLGNLASVIHYRGRLEEAEPMMRRRVELTRELRGPENLETLTAMSNLAALLGDMERLPEAEALNREVYEARLRVLGAEHPDTLVALNNLSYTLWHQGAREEAERLLRSALEITTRRLGPGHPSRLTVLNNLGSVLQELDRADEAERIFRELIELRSQTLGAQHPDTLMSMNNLAGIYMQRGRTDEAIALYRQVCAGAREVLGPDNPYTLKAQMNLAFALREQDELDEAERLALDVLLARQELLGPNHPDTLISRAELAKLRLEGGLPEDAAAMLMEVVQAARLGSLGPNHWYTAIFESSLGRALHRLGRMDEAEQALQSAYSSVCEQFGVEHYQTQVMIGRLVELYESRREPKMAEAFRLRLAATPD